MSLIAVNVAINLFRTEGWLVTLLEAAVSIFWVFLIYRLLIGLLYLALGRQRLRPYHYRLLLPLFALLVAGWLGGNLIDLNRLAQVELFTLFTMPTTLGRLFGVIVALYFLIAGTWLAHNLLKVVILPRTTIEPGAIDVALTIGRYLVIALGLLIIVDALGFDASTLAFIGAGLSVGIGFGLQQIFTNFISGILLLFEQSLRPGDVVIIDGQMGVVDKLSIRSTIVRTFDNVEIIVPNENLLTSTVTTYTKSSRIGRIVMTISVSYDSDPKEVLEILLQVAQEHGVVMDDPAPAVFFEAFGESSLDFHLAIWVDEPLHMKRVPSDLRLMIWKRFAERGIEIPYPQRDLHIRSGLPGEVLRDRSNAEDAEPASS